MRPDVAGVLAACDQLLEALARKRVRREKSRLEGRLEKAMAKAFRAQGKAFLKRFKALEKTHPIAAAEAQAEAAFWEDAWGDAADDTLELFRGPIDGATTTAVLQGAKAVIADVGAGIAFDLKSPEAVAFLRGRAAERVSMVNDTTKERLRTLIGSGVEGGFSYSEIAAAVKAEFEEFAVGKPQAHIDSRAHLIAITEIGEAYSEANLMGGRAIAAAGIAMEKSWSTIGDDRVSDGCLDNEGAGWIPLEDDFPSGHQRPLRFPGCRCDLLMRAQGAED